jgi:hypothetical protein
MTTKYPKGRARYRREIPIGECKTVAYNRVFVGLRCSSGAKGAFTTLPHCTVAAKVGSEDVRVRCLRSSYVSSVMRVGQGWEAAG